jgi:hypothetical protein
MRDLFGGKVIIRKIMPYHSENVFDQAGVKKQKEVLRYLTSIGFNLKKTMILHTGDSFEIIKYLVEDLGVPVNMSFENLSFSPLYLQTISALHLLKHQNYSIENVKEQFKIIQYLLQKGANIDDENISSDHKQLFDQIVKVQFDGETENVFIQKIIDSHLKQN